MADNTPETDQPSDQTFMAEAIRLAVEAGARGEVPVGAVAVRASTGEVIATAANQRESDADPTAHAEILCIRAAARAAGSWRLNDVTLYVSLEPCPMCAGALVAARVQRVVFAAADPKAGACGSLYNLLADPRLNHEPRLTAGVLADDAAAVLTDWFAAQRATT